MSATRRSAAVTRGRVHDAALDLFLARGYEGTSLATIARRLGITKAAVYYYYRTKGDLVAALLAPLWTELTHLVESLGSSAEPPEPDELLDAYAEVLLRHRELMLLVDRDPGIRCQPAVQSELLARRQQLETAILGEHPDEDAHLRLLILRAGISEALLAFPTWDTERLRSALLRIAHTLMDREQPPAPRPAPSSPESRPNPPAGGAGADEVESSAS